ncbi:MAG: hypothetical protein WC120_01145 [Parcubacteria group bacterium]
MFGREQEYLPAKTNTQTNSRYQSQDFENRRQFLFGDCLLFFLLKLSKEVRHDAQGSNPYFNPEPDLFQDRARWSQGTSL